MAGVGVAVAGATALAVHGARVLPPHEDEALALFVGRGSFLDVLDTVSTERGGAPLHFLIAWAVAHAGGGLQALRLVSVAAAALALVAVAALAARLAGRVVAVVTVILAAGSWVVLYNASFGRMYAPFLLATTLAFIAQLEALERGGWGRHALWAAALLMAAALHPYGAVVLVAQALFLVLHRPRERRAWAVLAGVAVAGLPLWRSYALLSDRYGLGVEADREPGNGPSLLSYLRTVGSDFSAGWTPASLGVLAVAALGVLVLARTRPRSAKLVLSAFAAPLAFLLVVFPATSASPESRHLIFALPFFSLLVAVGLVRLAATRPPVTYALAAAVGTAIVCLELAWAEQRTPQLFRGDPIRVVEARSAAASWLARTGRIDDVLLGYEPLFLRAWEQNRAFSDTVVPRADSRLASERLREAGNPLGRGVWVLDAREGELRDPHAEALRVSPQPAEAFVVTRFGPYLVTRSRRPLSTSAQYLAASRRVLLFGRRAGITDATVALLTLEDAGRRLQEG